MRGAALGRWAGLGLEHDHELECLGPWSTTCAMRERGREAKGCTVVPWGSRVPHVEVGAEGWNLEDLILLYSWHSFATLRWQLPTARFMDHAPQHSSRSRSSVRRSSFRICLYCQFIHQ